MRLTILSIFLMNSSLQTSKCNKALVEKCGVFGVFGSPSALQYSVLGLRALQHRGQEACGITVMQRDDNSTQPRDGLKSPGIFCDNSNQNKNIEEKMQSHYCDGLVNESVFYDAFHMNSTIHSSINSAIGHVRYSTSGEKGGGINVQPLIEYVDGIGEVAIAHNGNLTNERLIREDLQRNHNVIFKTTVDTEVFGKLLQKSQAQTMEEKLIDVLGIVKGAYSLVILYKGCLIGIRDEFAIRPLVLGSTEDGGYVFASETCALDAIGATMIRDVTGGEAVIIRPSENGPSISTTRIAKRVQSRNCLFEYIYFARSNSMIDGISVYKARKNVGNILARNYPVKADIVVPIPDSSMEAAVGYSEESKIPLELAIVRNGYINRTFITLSSKREAALRIKYSVNRHLVEGKSVVLVDDSLVRGNTARSIISRMRKFGAREIHMRIASPPVKHCCFYGIDTPNIAELISSKVSKSSLMEMLQLDSLEFATINDLYLATILEDRNDNALKLCDACFTGAYPVKIDDLPPEGSKAVQVTSCFVRIDGKVKNLHINKINSKTWDFDLLKFFRIFDAERARYSFQIDREKPYGVYIFLNDIAAANIRPFITKDDGLNEFISYCSVRQVSNFSNLFYEELKGITETNGVLVVVPSSYVQESLQNQEAICSISADPRSPNFNASYLEIIDIGPPINL